MIWKKNQKRSFFNKLLNGMEFADFMFPNVQNADLNTNLSVNENIFKDIFQGSSDIVFRPIEVQGETKLLFIYIDGLCDSKTLEQVALRPLMFDGLPDALGKVPNGTITKVQKVYGTDIFGFGDAIKRKNLHQWNSLKKNWSKEFSEAEVSVQANLTVRKIGVTGPSLIQ